MIPSVRVDSWMPPWRVLARQLMLTEGFGARELAPIENQTIYTVIYQVQVSYALERVQVRVTINAISASQVA
jgi:hypothetical protein